MKAIISGASRGIGRAIAIRLAQVGYDLLLMSRSKSELEQLKDEILEKSSVEIQILSIDLGNQKEIKKAAIQAAKQDKLILINNVGSYLNDQAGSLEIEDLDRLMHINLYSAIELSKKLEADLRAAESALVINLLSVNALESDIHASSYSISKHAFKAWNDAYRKEMQKKGIKVSAIYPGAVNTSSWDGTRADRESMIQSEDIAEMVYSLSQLGRTALVEEIRIMPLNFKLD